MLGYVVRRKFVLLLFGTLAALAVGASSVASADDEIKPAPVTFPASYGEMTFPQQYPDGTAIRITQWSHFVPRYDEWFDQYAQKWADAHNVDVTVTHIGIADIPSTLASSIAAGKGPTMMEMLVAPAAFVEGLTPINDVNAAAKATFGDRAPACGHSSYLPVKDMWYGFCHGWVPVAGAYRTDLWAAAGYPDGPKSYAELLEGGGKIFEQTGIPVVAGMSPSLDSELFIRAVIWSFGGSIQDGNGTVVLDSPETLAAIQYIKKLYEAAMTPEVFAQNAASNNQSFIVGHASFIGNSISFFRSAQSIDSPMAAKTGFRPGLTGPTGKAYFPANLYYTYVIPKYVTDTTEILAAKNFMLDLENNYSSASFYSKFYNLPAFSSQVPQLYADGGWLSNDPWGSKPTDKLAFLKNVEDWATWPGYPGYSNPAVSEVYQTHVLTTMMAKVARGVATAEEAIDDAAGQIRAIFAKWRERGFVRGGG